MTLAAYGLGRSRSYNRKYAMISPLIDVKVMKVDTEYLNKLCQAKQEKKMLQPKICNTQHL